MVQEVQVVYVSRYNFVSDDTGEVLKGCKVTYLSKELLKDKDYVGYKCNTANLPYEVYDDFINQKFPCKCEIELEIIDINKKPKVKNIRLI